MAETFSGVLAALVTPLDATRNIDEWALARLLDHVRQGGVSGVCPVGSTGEGPHLTAQLRGKMARLVRRELGTGFPIIPALASTAFEDARRQVEDYAEAGATAVLAAPPFYYLLPQSGVLDFFASLADVSPLPILLYNIPHLTKVAMTPETVLALAKHPKIVGMKDSSRDFEFFEMVASSMPPDFSLLTGTDTMLLASMLVGGHGTIAASANLVPDWSVALLDALRAQEMELAREIQFRLLRLVLACRRGSFPAGWKAALELLGLCSGQTASPIPRLPKELIRDLRVDLEKAGLKLITPPASS